MSKPGLCCDNCIELIASRNTAAARLWLELCEIQAKQSHDKFGLKINDMDELRLLELMRFITTTETMNGIIVKVHGLKKDYFGTFFCGGKCNES